MSSVSASRHVHGTVARLISARSTAAGKTKSAPRCRRRRARARRTTTAAAAAGEEASARSALMVPALRFDLAAKHPIGPGSIAEDERDQSGDADQHEELAVLRCRRLPDRNALRHDIGIHA